MKIKKWLFNYFSEKADGDFSLDDDFFTQGIIDSFDVIILIDSIESEFDIEFSENIFQDRRFSTVNGLADIIEEIISEKKKSL